MESKIYKWRIFAEKGDKFDFKMLTFNYLCFVTNVIAIAVVKKIFLITIAIFVYIFLQGKINLTNKTDKNNS